MNNNNFSLNKITTKVNNNEVLNFSLSNVFENISTFSNKAKFEENFNISGDHLFKEGNKFKVFASSASSKKSLFGYDKINIIYTGDRPWAPHVSFFNDNAVSFYGTNDPNSEQASNVTFNLEFKLASILQNNLKDIKTFLMKKLIMFLRFQMLWYLNMKI